MNNRKRLILYVLALLLAFGLAVHLMTPRSRRLMRAPASSRFSGWTDWDASGARVLVSTVSASASATPEKLRVWAVSTVDTQSRLVSDSLPFSGPQFVGTDGDVLVAEGETYPIELVLRNASSEQRRVVCHSDGDWRIVCAATSSPAKLLATVEARSNPQAYRIVLTDMTSGRRLVRLERPGAASGLAWSPDGRLIAWNDLGLAPMVMRVAEHGTPTKLSPPVEYPILSPRQPWSPDSRMIVGSSLSDDRTTLWSVDVDSGRAQVLAVVPGVRYNFGAGCVWSPDGTRIAFGTAALGPTGMGFSIHVLYLRGSTTEVVLEPVDQEIHGLSWSPDSRRIAYTRGRALEAMRVRSVGIQRRGD